MNLEIKVIENNENKEDRKVGSYTFYYQDTPVPFTFYITNQINLNIEPKYFPF